MWQEWADSLVSQVDLVVSLELELEIHQSQIQNHKSLMTASTKTIKIFNFYFKHFPIIRLTSCSLKNCKAEDEL